jgi:hypothetical protein
MPSVSVAPTPRYAGTRVFRRICEVGAWALAARVIWYTWLYYFEGAPRYRLESAAMLWLVAASLAAGLRPADEVSTNERADFKTWWVFVFVVGAFTLYANALTLGLLSDDYVLLDMARSATLGLDRGWFIRPTPILVWRATLSFVDSPVLLHSINIALHGVNAFLVARLTHHLGARPHIALFAGALFLTFPAAPEAVAWVAGLQDVLMTSAALGTVLAARSYLLEGTALWRVLAAFSAALLSKETAICIPALIVLCWIDQRTWGRRAARLVAAIAAVSIVYLTVHVSIGAPAQYPAPSRYALKQIVVLAFGTLVVPWRLPEGDLMRWLSFGAATSCTLLVSRALLGYAGEIRRRRLCAQLALWPVLAVAPVFTFFFVGPSLEGARYVYLAECSWAIVMAHLLATTSIQRSRLAMLGWCGQILILAISTLMLQRELAVWRGAATLRDAALSSARIEMAATGCKDAAFLGVPDTFRGAHVFRNGFREAMGLPEPMTALAETCVFEWQDGHFRPSTTRGH